MNTASALPPSSVAAVGSPAGISAAEAWDEICAGMGIATLSAEDAANLMPWTEEEAATFARTIEEVFEHVDPAVA